MSAIDTFWSFPSLAASKLKHPLPNSPEYSSQTLHSLPQGTAPTRLCFHWRAAGRAGNIIHAAAQSQGLSAAELSLRKGSAAQRVCPGSRLANLHWSPSPSCTLALESSMGQSISPNALIPQDREPPDCPTHLAKLACLFLGVFIELRISPSKPSKAHVCVCHQPTSHRMLGISISSLHGQDLLSSPDMCWLFACVCSKPALQDNHISKFITRAQTARESVRDRKLWQLGLLVARGHSL